MKDKGIITNDKQRFLDAERPYFSIMTNAQYKEIMYDYLVCCEKCGVWSWDECAKRCNCK
jgi:hypothetical protein